jgi:hypothetical protein
MQQDQILLAVKLIEFPRASFFSFAKIENLPDQVFQANSLNELGKRPLYFVQAEHYYSK